MADKNFLDIIIHGFVVGGISTLLWILYCIMAVMLYARNFKYALRLFGNFREMIIKRILLTFICGFAVIIITETIAHFIVVWGLVK